MQKELVAKETPLPTLLWRLAGLDVQLGKIRPILRERLADVPHLGFKFDWLLPNATARPTQHNVRFDSCLLSNSFLPGRTLKVTSGAEGDGGEIEQQASHFAKDLQCRAFQLGRLCFLAALARLKATLDQLSGIEAKAKVHMRQKNHK